MGYKVKLNVFEGPFDLLVYLIESARMSIYDIKVSEITSQYVAYIEEMNQMDVAVSSEFMVLAAELIELKSKMLLPTLKSEENDSEYEDPRNELVEKLLEYKRFKNISEIFATREETNERIHEKPQEDISKYTDEPDEYLDLDIKHFVIAFNNFLIKKKKVEDVRKRYERVERERISVEERVDFIRKLFEEDSKRVVPFGKIVQNKEDKQDVVVSFSSILELVKQHSILAEQKVIFGEILVKATKTLQEELAENLQGENK